MSISADVAVKVPVNTSNTIKLDLDQVQKKSLKPVQPIEARKSVASTANEKSVSVGKKLDIKV